MPRRPDTVPRCATTGKLAFRTKKKAQRAAEGVRRGNGPTLHAYRCECGAWHLSKSAPRRAWRPKARAGSGG